MISHHNLIGHEINISLSEYGDDPLDRTIYCRKLHQVTEPLKEECEKCICFAGLEQGHGFECRWADVVKEDYVVKHENRYGEYERVDILIKTGRLTPKPYDKEKWIYENSVDNKYRFALGEKGKKMLICFGINPSTATPELLDHTMKLVHKRASVLGYDGYLMLNVYPQRSTNPKEMDKNENQDAIKKNLLEIDKQLSRGKVDIWAAWGNDIDTRPYLKECLSKIIEISDRYNCRWLKADVSNKSGHPHHPTRLSNDAKLVRFDVREYFKNTWGE